MRVGRNLYGHARTLGLAVSAIASPAIALYVVQIGVLRHLYDDAPLVDVEIASIASPAAAGSIQISVRRHDYPHAGVPDTPKSARAVPTAPVATHPRMFRQLARSGRRGQRCPSSKPQQERREAGHSSWIFAVAGHCVVDLNEPTPRRPYASVQSAAATLEKMHAAILRSREESNVIPTPVLIDDSTQDPKQADERCLMAELSIIRAGRHYFYDGYRYQSLSEAVAYAQIVQGHKRRAVPSASL